MTPSWFCGEMRVLLLSVTSHSWHSSGMPAIGTNDNHVGCPPPAGSKIRFKATIAATYQAAFYTQSR